MIGRWRRRRWQYWLCFGTDDPIYGESAFIEIKYRDQPWAYVALEGIDTNAVGDARTSAARVYVMLVDENDARDDWDNPIKRDFAEALDHVAMALTPRSLARQARRALEDARERVLENERGRLPVDRDGLTVFGAAFSQLSASDPLRQDLISDERAT